MLTIFITNVSILVCLTDRQMQESRKITKPVFKCLYNLKCNKENIWEVPV